MVAADIARRGTRRISRFDARCRSRRTVPRPRFKRDVNADLPGAGGCGAALGELILPGLDSLSVVRLPARIPPLAITAYTVTCAAARGLDALSEAVRERRGGLVENNLADHPLPCFIGRV